MIISPSTPLPSWLERRSRWIFWGLLVLSLAIRAVYAVQFSESPLREWHRWPDSDMAFFDEWSQDIAKGNWLQRQPHHPLHSWHVELAKLYYEESGTAPPPNVAPEMAARTLWNRWYGGVRFHQEPFYPYFLAILKRITHRPLMVLFGLQLLAGVLTNVLVWDITRRCFGPLAGLVAGLLAALSPTLMYVDLVLLRESFITCAGLGLVGLTLRAIGSGTRRDWAILGLAAGVTLLLKATFLIFVAGCAMACLVRIRKQSEAALQLVLFVMGVLVGISPAVVRNAVVGAPTFSLSSVATITFINTNAADSDAMGFPISGEHAPRIMRQTGGSLGPAVIETWRTHTPQSLARLMGRKWSGLWNGFEAPDNLSFAYFQLQTPVLKWLPFTFVVLSPLALVGLGLSFFVQRRPLANNAAGADSAMEVVKAVPIWPLWLLVANHLIALQFFTQVGRLRVPLVAALIPFAAFAIVQLHDWLWHSRGKGIALLVALGLAIAWTVASTPPGFAEYRVADFAVADELFYKPRIDAAAQTGDWALAAKLLKQSLQSEPERIRKLRAGSELQNDQERMLAQFFGELHERYANALQENGQAEAAAAERVRSRELHALVGAKS